MWIRQAERTKGAIFSDSYLHPECDFITSWKTKEIMIEQRTVHLDRLRDLHAQFKRRS